MLIGNHHDLIRRFWKCLRIDDWRLLNRRRRQFRLWLWLNGLPQCIHFLLPFRLHITVYHFTDGFPGFLDGLISQLLLGFFNRINGIDDVLNLFFGQLANFIADGINHPFINRERIFLQIFKACIYPVLM
ncbi:Uncharacterised protein [Mycobacteroides abscessus subsp. abscessus]|nr:Uncharacterised protein [Mycobacteroides abscessus subsp. abscessus]